MKPTRTFNADIGQTSVDSRGPDAIEKDIDLINKMFDPNATHANGEQGGIGKSNLNDTILDDGSASGESMAERIGSKAITGLNNPISGAGLAVTVWKQIKSLFDMFISHQSNQSNPHGITKEQVGLGNVTNDKQVTKVELDSHALSTENPHSVTKAQVGLGNVLNERQATRTELDYHMNTTTNPNPHKVTKDQVGLGEIINLRQATKAEFDSHTNYTLYPNPHKVTKEQVGLGNVTNDAQATKDEFYSHVMSGTNPHSVTKAQVGLQSVIDATQATKYEFYNHVFSW